jgi:hypothetical protein
MRAMVLSAPGASLQMQERAEPTPGDGLRTGQILGAAVLQP